MRQIRRITAERQLSGDQEEHGALHQYRYLLGRSDGRADDDMGSERPHRRSRQRFVQQRLEEERRERDTPGSLFVDPSPIRAYQRDQGRDVEGEVHRYQHGVDDANDAVVVVVARAAASYLPMHDR